MLSPGTVISINSEVETTLETLARAGSTDATSGSPLPSDSAGGARNPQSAIARQVGVSRHRLSVRSAFAQGGVKPFDMTPYASARAAS